MKLLTKYNRVSLLTTIFVIAVAGFIYYFTISYILTSQVDKDLLVEEHEIFDYVELNRKLPQVFKSDDLKIHFEAIGADTVNRRFLDSRYYDEHEHEEESGRTLISSVKVGLQRYRIIITESRVETDYLIRFIFFITLGIIFLLLSVLLVLNRVLMRKLWHPFYLMLQEIKQFNLTASKGITNPATEIEEFVDLNREVTAMSQRVLQDYQSLKGFVENAAHELMTPLAVVNSKLDTLVQGSALTDQQGKLISEVYDTLGKMKRLNRSMLLLSRIENKLMPEQEDIELGTYIDEKIIEFQELLAAREITVSQKLLPFTLRINRDLLAILLNNLIGNAILHNHPQGTLAIKLNESQLTISNTSAFSPLDEQLIFQRFHKSAASEGTGLGLTLAKEICESYGFGIHYTYENDLHTFSIDLKS